MEPWRLEFLSDGSELLYTFFIVFLFISCKKDTDKIPYFEFNTVNGTTINNNNLPKNKKIVFCYLDSNCYSCNQFIDEINKFKKNNFFYIIVIKKSNNSLKKYNNSDNVLISIDTEQKFNNYFNLGFIIDFPTFIIYDNNIKTITNNKNIILNSN